MVPEVGKFFFDVKESCAAILTFIEGKSLADHEANRQRRSAVARELIAVG